VLAYGQTGSGKTHTMGTDARAHRFANPKSSDPVVPWALHRLFEHLQKATQTHVVTLMVSR
jgi:hypothetical protein